MRFLNLTQIENKAKQNKFCMAKKIDELSSLQNNDFKKKCQLIDKKTCKYAANLFGKMLDVSFFVFNHIIFAFREKYYKQQYFVVVHCSLLQSYTVQKIEKRRLRIGENKLDFLVKMFEMPSQRQFH